MKSSRPPETDILPGECLDHFMGGSLKLIQSRDGYRFSIDAVMLAEFVTARNEDIVLDLGTGCGIIPLVLLHKKTIKHAIGLEIQEELASQAIRNAKLNDFRDRMDVIIGDIKDPPLCEKTADVVICNPPYRGVKNGRINPDPRRAIARHELLATTEDILMAAHDLLRKKGRLALVYPSVRLTDILSSMRKYNLEPKRIRINYPNPDSGAKLVLIEAVLRGKPGLHVEPPLFGQGGYSIQDPP
jgi:tRNA1Val (adenine37-N6)-methyltransferase